MDETAIKEMVNALSPALVDVADASDDVPRLILRKRGYELHSLEQFQAAPCRTKRVVTALAPEDFVAYVQRFGNSDTAVFANTKASSFRAIIDYDGRSEPAWGDHKMLYTPEHSLQWQAWAAQHKKHMTQLEFAYFLEERLSDFYEPKGAKVLEAALDFQQHQNFNVASFQNLDSGEIRFNMAKENARADVEFPHNFRLFLPIFDGDDDVFVDCRLRYRVSNEGVLALWYQFVRQPEELVREGFDKIVTKLRDELAEDHFFCVGTL
jgi:uncharacterized protein YfdQ (DUF2303 family)